VSEHLKADQSQLTKTFALVACFASCSLSDPSWQRFPGKPCKEHKTHSRLSYALSNTHTFVL